MKVASLTSAGIVLGAMVLFSLPAEALRVTPGRQELLLKPGTSMKLEYEVTNDAQEPLQIEVTRKDWFIYEANKNLTADRWIVLKKPVRFELEPGKSRRVQVTVKCPKETQGELVGMVSFTYQSAEPSMITPMLSLSVYVRAEGTEKISGEIQTIYAEMVRGKLVLGVQVKATGNVHLRPTGSLRLLKDNGLEVVKLDIREGDPAYPGGDRSYFGTPLEQALAPGRYQVIAEMRDHDLQLQSERRFSVLKDGKIRMEDAL